MILTATILFFVFGLFSLHGAAKFLLTKITVPHAILVFVSTIITALSAGVIWGDILNYVLV